MLREDNADQRLTEIGYQLGAVSETRYQQWLRKQAAIARGMDTLQNTLSPNSAQFDKAEAMLGLPLQETNLAALVKRPTVDYAMLATHLDLPRYAESVEQQLAVQLKYAGYIDRQQEVERLQRHGNTPIPRDSSSTR